jgi:hypothetical protein
MAREMLSILPIPNPQNKSNPLIYREIANFIPMNFHLFALQ